MPQLHYNNSSSPSSVVDPNASSSFDQALPLIPSDMHIATNTSSFLGNSKRRMVLSPSLHPPQQQRWHCCLNTQRPPRAYHSLDPPGRPAAAEQSPSPADTTYSYPHLTSAVAAVLLSAARSSAKAKLSSAPMVGHRPVNPPVEPSHTTHTCLHHTR